MVQKVKAMSQLAQIAQTLNEIADKKQTTPDDVLNAGTDSDGAFESVVEELDAHKRRAVADARECADVVAAAQRLKDATDARAAAFKASLADFIEARCRAVEAEYDALIKAKQDEFDALIAAEAAEVEALRREKCGKVDKLLDLLDFDEFGTVNMSDFLFVGKCTRQLKEWTGKAHGDVIYDSKADPFTADGLFEKVKGKENIALIATTSDGDVFGGFYRHDVTEQNRLFSNPTIFIFSFESHGRCTTPKRFSVKERLKQKATVCFNNNHINGFVDFWVDNAGGFFLGNQKSNSVCVNLSRGFEGIHDTTLTGKNGTNLIGPYHHCTRLVAVQLS